MTTHNPTKGIVRKAEMDLAALNGIEEFLLLQEDEWEIRDRGYAINNKLRDATGVVVANSAISRVVRELNPDQEVARFHLRKADLASVSRVRASLHRTLGIVEAGVVTERGYTRVVPSTGMDTMPKIDLTRRQKTGQRA